MNVEVIRQSVFPWQVYLQLCKPKVILLVIFTAMVAMVLAVPPDALDWRVLLPATLGISLAAASAAAFNHVFDRDIDARMLRTQKRPLPTHAVSRNAALTFAMLLGSGSMLLLWFAVNPLTAWLTLFTLIGYAVIYTRYLKWIGPQNIVLGGASGAAPVLLGWTAMTGELGWQPLSLFLIVFIWTPPHFWALAIARHEEYARAGVPMLPVTHGIAATKYHILAYTVLLFGVSFMPWLTGLSGTLYVMGAMLMGGVFIVRAWRLIGDDASRTAMGLFAYSITYLTALFSLLLLDHFMLFYFGG